MQRIVAKFGGTSMGSADAMRNASDIVRSLDAEVIVVVSAVGGTTDKLIALGRSAVEGGDWQAALAVIQERHAAIESDLGLERDFGNDGFWHQIEEICRGVAMLGELSPSTLDRLQSFGERMSATLFAALLNTGGTHARMIDAFSLVATDDQFGCANVNFPSTNEATVAVLSPMLAGRVVPIVTGFIGKSASGKYSTLGRGGSDYSAAIIAAAIDATELQIWTDVDGMFTADPRFIPSATALAQLSFNEAGELAYFGAKVLHPKTIKPAIEKGIPVRVLNTFNAKAQGTLITSEERPSIKSVTSKTGITVVTICSLGMLGAHGFLARAFDVFARNKVVVDVLSSSEVSVSVTVDRGLPPGLVDDLRAFASVEVDTGMAIVCLVGEGIRTRTDVLSKLFAAIDVPVRMVSQGASRRNITFVVAESDAKPVVTRIFRAFFEP
jgi:aspartate kinase